jgi:hypothetical protein
MPEIPEKQPAAPAYAVGDDPEELICRCDWPKLVCLAHFFPSCGRPDPGFRTRREIEPWRFRPQRGNAKKKGGKR